MFFRELQKKVGVHERSLQRVSHAALELIKAKEQRIKELEAALQSIVEWDTHPIDLAVNQGSNGVRDFYRYKANEAIVGNKGGE